MKSATLIHSKSPIWPTYSQRMTSPHFAPPAHEAPASPEVTRRELLASTKRGFAPVRHIFVQKPRNAKRPRAQRGALLGELVSGHQERALDALLLVLALEPILGENDPLHSAVWGRLLSDDEIKVGSVSRTWKQLTDRKLITKVRRAGHALVRPRREDGKAAYTRPGKAAREEGSGWPRGDWYFVIPHEYWLEGWDQKLSLPAKAMLLIALKETGTSPSFWMRHDDAPAWYGISSDTAQRGLAELVSEGLMQVFHQKIAAAKSPSGYTTRDHYTLRSPFSMDARKALQATTQAAVEGARKAAHGKATSTAAGTMATTATTGGMKTTKAAGTKTAGTKAAKATGTKSAGATRRAARKAVGRKPTVEKERG